MPVSIFFSVTTLDRCLRVNSRTPPGGSSVEFLAILCRHYCLPYASLIAEIGFDGDILCEVELELPQLELVIPRHRYFFWTTVTTFFAVAYEQSALQAIAFLHRLYISSK